MKGKILAICTQEAVYAKCLSEYILGRRELSFQVMVFSDLEKLSLFGKEKKIDILLTDHTLTDRKQMEIGQVFLLCDSRSCEKTERYISVYKYQSGEKILTEVLGHCAEQVGSETILRIQKADMEIIGVYSPIHRIGKTQYALQTAKEFAKKGNTLYLNLEEYAGNWEEGGQGDGLAELLYYLRQGCRNIGLRIEMLVKHYESVDYLEPVKMYPDLKAVTAEEWKLLLTEIAEKSIYETVILDIGDSIQGTYELLELCSCVYTLFAEEEMAQRKISQYRKSLVFMGLESIVEKTIFVEVKELL